MRSAANSSYRKSAFIGFSAFTLVELLVVMGIIATLVGILMPALARSRATANQISCASNLRQLGSALELYTSQSRYYPGSCFFRNGRAIAVWPARLRQALGLTATEGALRVFWCPAREEDLRWQAPRGSGSGVAADTDAGFGYEPGERFLDIGRDTFSYGYNDWGAALKQGPPFGTSMQRGLGGDIIPTIAGMKEMRSSRIRNASEMIALADSTPDHWWDFSIDPNAPREYPGDIHNKGANVLFCDGHVQWYAQSTLIDCNTGEKHPNNRLWNNNHKVVLPPDDHELD